MRWLVLLALMPVFSQTPGIIEGSIVDASGAQIPGATAELASTETGPSLADIRTDDRGRFRFPAVPPGDYYLRFRAPGFFTSRRGLLTITPGSRIDTGKVQLAVGFFGCCGCEAAAPRFLIESAQGASFGGRVNAARMDLDGEATLIPSAGSPIRIRIEDDGSFEFKALNPGHYALTITAPTYAVFEILKVEIAPGTGVRVDGLITPSDCPPASVCKPTRTVQRERKSKHPAICL